MGIDDHFQRLIIRSLGKGVVGGEYSGGNPARAAASAMR
jgi:hypothetical protein